MNDKKVRIQNMEEGCKWTNITVSALDKCVQECEKEKEDLRTRNLPISKLNNDLITKRMAPSPTPTAKLSKTSILCPFPHKVRFSDRPGKSHTCLASQRGE